MYKLVEIMSTSLSRRTTVRHRDLKRYLKLSLPMKTGAWIAKTNCSAINIKYIF